MKKQKMTCQRCNHKWELEIPEGGEVIVGKDGLVNVVTPVGPALAETKVAFCPNCKRYDGVLRYETKAGPAK